MRRKCKWERIREGENGNEIERANKKNTEMTTKSRKVKYERERDYGEELEGGGSVVWVRLKAVL